MIRRVFLQNLVLVEECSLELGEHFNVITGETGAGKTAFTEGIALCLGQRAQIDLIRKGCDKAIAEMSIDITLSPAVQQLLHEAGIETDEELILRRELLSSGKSRAFINCRAAPLPLLQQIGSFLVDTVSQHSTHLLRSSETQRFLLDLFADLKEPLSSFQQSFTKEQALLKDKEDLQAQLVGKEKREALLRFQLEELTQASLKEGEEEQLFALHDKCSSAKKLMETLSSWQQESATLITQLGRLQKRSVSIASLDPKLQEASKLLEEALIPLRESSYLIEAFDTEGLDDPKQRDKIEERLSLIQSLKRKYGPTLLDVLSTQTKLQEELDYLDNLIPELERIESAYLHSQSKTNIDAATLSKKRKQAATTLASLLTQELHTLNMPKASVTIELLKTSRHSYGDEEVSFFIQANPGEHGSLVKEHASGGEIARLLLALKLVLAEKNQTPTLIFDEIDANVGGRTAALIGEKLKALGQKKQVLCITHFPQVAAASDTHFQVEKIEQEGRTLTQIRHLSQNQIAEELLRMGGHQ